MILLHAEFERLDEGTGERLKFNRWCVIEEFKASSTQLVRYLKWKQEGLRQQAEEVKEMRQTLYNGRDPELTQKIKDLEEMAEDYEVPISLKTKRETTSKQELEEMYINTGDKVLEKVVRIRSYDTNITNYIPNWKPSKDGRVHTTWGFTAPSGQFDARRPNILNCFSDDTEILTNRGWIVFPELLSTDLVAEYRLDGSIALVLPIGYVKNPFKGKLQHISTYEQIDLMITKEHDCLIQNRKTKKFYKYKAIDYPSDVRQIQAGKFIGGNVSLRESQIALICAYQADGHGVQAPRLRGECIIWGLSKERKIERLRWALDEEHIVYTETLHEKPHGKYNETTSFYIGTNDIPEWLKGKKIFGGWILTLDYKSLNTLSEEVFLWDGCLSLRTTSYASSRKINSDWVQIIMTLTDCRAKMTGVITSNPNAKTSWQVYVSNNNYSLTTNHENKEVDYDGMVYCVTVPSGNIVVRRNNRVAITGNCSKHTEFGNEFRGIIEAPKGRCFVEFDKKSFHVGTLGYCANDKEYIRFSQIDPHSILGSYIDPSVIGQSISLKWSDADIVSAAKEFKKRCKEHKAKDPQHNVDVRQELAKPTVLGNQLELGPKKLQRQNRRFIEYAYESQRIAHKGKGYSAEGLQKIVSDLFPKEVIYKAQIKEKAHIEKFLINEFGRIQYFYDVFNFSFSKKLNKWIKKDGDGARDPIAFRVQGCAFGMIQDEMLEMERQGLMEEYQFLVSIHDSVMFMPEKSKLDKCIESVIKIMNAPCRKLVNEATGKEGLRIMVECSVGPNWKEMKEIKL